VTVTTVIDSSSRYPSEGERAAQKQSKNETPNVSTSSLYRKTVRPQFVLLIVCNHSCIHKPCMSKPLALPSYGNLNDILTKQKLLALWSGSKSNKCFFSLSNQP
jgi:hypothetical protein